MPELEPESDSLEGGVQPYGGAEQTTYGGSKRRKRGKRNSKKNSRRRSKKYMKKTYRGGDVEGAPETTSESDNKEQVKDVDTGTMNTDAMNSNPVGGRRRRKGKMQKRKTRKGKVSKWITHVKNFSRANKMDFRDALKDPKCKASYHKMK
jgi:hypothetical protein